MQRRTVVIVLSALAMIATLAVPASADHADPNTSRTGTPAEGRPGGEPAMIRGEGAWDHVVNFPLHQGSDITFFDAGGQTFTAQGTLGQGPQGTPHVGQRIIRLVDEEGRLRPQLRADHASASCFQPATGVTGLQHDNFATPAVDPELLIDTTDSVNRCHDTAGGGIELIDISGIADPAFQPREVHLFRFDATTHTATLDPQRPWIIYSNNSAFANSNWLEVINLKSCMTTANGGVLPTNASLDVKRAQCAPVVHRIPFDNIWTMQTTDGQGPPAGDPASCHDIVIEDDTIYCSGLLGEVILDVSGMFDAQGDVRGIPLPCTRGDASPGTGVSTGAKVTDCRIGNKAAYEALDPKPQATGWELVGFYNHPGTDQANTNTQVPADQGVAISHETRPVPLAGTDRKFIVVSDERGGGIVPGGGSCDGGNFDDIGNGGLHFLDVTDPDNIEYAEMVDDEGNVARAVWRGEVVQPSATFCVVHRFRFLEGEQRMVMGYYTQGIKFLDYELDEDGRFRFNEVASHLLPSANTWTADVFRTRDNADGTRTYSIAASDTLGSFPAARGLDVLTWTAAPNPIREVGSPRPAATIGRISGPNRFGTAVAVSQARFEESDTVFLARADDYADALAGGPLAAAEGAPILLTERNRLTPVTEDEVTRLGATRAVLLGGDAAVGPEVAARLEELGVDVERVAGRNRWSTAAEVARALGDDSGTVFLTEGFNAQRTRGWPDAMSAAPYAGHAGQPILLTMAGELPVETREALEELGAEETIVVGGNAAVSDGVVAALEAADHGPRRLAGRNRFETSAAVYREAIDEAGMTPSVLWLATGGDWPDALTAGATAGAAGQMVILVAGGTLDDSPATRDLIAERRGDIRHINLLGGRAAISANVAGQVRSILDAPQSEDAGAAPFGTAGRSPLLPASPPAEGLLLLLAGLLLPAAAVLGRRRQVRLAT